MNTSSSLLVQSYCFLVVGIALVEMSMENGHGNVSFSNLVLFYLLVMLPVTFNTNYIYMEKNRI